MNPTARPQGVPLQIAITTGEPAGVGPELTAQALAGAAAHWPDAQFTVLGDADLLAGRARAVAVDWAHLPKDRVRMQHVPLGVPSQAGRLDAANGRYVLTLLDEAIDGAVSGAFDAIVTAPLQKSTINDAGVPFTGHTEYLAERTHTPRVVMMLAGSGPRPLRVALATTHLPLKDVSAALTIDGLVETLRIIDHDLRHHFGLPAPRILVTGLNPHAGENGYLGREEIDVITPALKEANGQGIDARGPYPADTLFQPRYLKDADCVLAMFHDQGLPVLKYATFGEGINITLGLPIIRTSVDHGTALDLAGTGRADSGSLIAAIDTAVSMARHRRAT
ncbi:4-hydroxythreonine-4-phosphate dehydrogenase PdxA [Paraburkholderia sp. BL10I2N1]|uniref:4-hydroxythreonine-4-phosphate dehydrogenase PdxA n=1 Tax=Paraburkholderia sp. BL10I2N1 TaxID=1938796 RepID=UPI001060E91F|nr:4-hydroxythreonine-4-phosphate dehydrogenase PdxA [Paraburkholderia sp. BL10I2N1]TDN68497.1 4-hydroxythreonine-4-phosphate dehydrogenase [Paraburkholderia sp. BL10I2N1]